MEGAVAGVLDEIRDRCSGNTTFLSSANERVVDLSDDCETALEW